MPPNSSQLLSVPYWTPYTPASTNPEKNNHAEKNRSVRYIFIWHLYLTPLFDIIIQHYLYYVNHFDPPHEIFHSLYRNQDAWAAILWIITNHSGSFLNESFLSAFKINFYTPKATPHNGARRFGERFWPERKYGKCGNTGYISHFSYCTIGAKDPLKPAAPT